MTPAAAAESPTKVAPPPCGEPTAAAAGQLGERLAALERDHRDALWLLDALLPGRIHKDVRCHKAPPPHVVTVECTHVETGPAATAGPLGVLERAALEGGPDA